MKSVFTPAAKVLKFKLDAGTTRMLQKRSKGKQPGVKETSRYFTLPAGESSAERTTGCIKGVMRRFHNSGRVTKSPIQALSAAALHRRCGFAKALDAMKLHRQDSSRRVIYMDAQKTFDSASCTWLHK